MVLIFGGSYQGKRKYALNMYKLTDDDIFYCKRDNIDLDLTKKVIYGLDKYILALIENDVDPSEKLEQFIPKLSNKIVICDDVSSSIVPIDPVMRKWRESVGKGLTVLSQNSDEVIRLFCGIGKKLK